MRIEIPQGKAKDKGEHVCVPECCKNAELPPGSFTLEDLQALPCASKKMQSYWLPASRLVDLVVGEEARGECSFNQNHHKKPGEPKRLRHDSVFETYELQCCFGPFDKRGEAELQPVILSRGKPEQRREREKRVTEACRCVTCGDIYIPGMGCQCGGPAPLADMDAEAAVTEELGGQRRSKAKAGESIKVGCQFSMRVTMYRACPDWACVRVKHLEHMDVAGAPCHGAACTAVAGSRLARAAHVTPRTREWVRQQLVSGVLEARIVQGTWETMVGLGEFYDGGPREKDPCRLAAAENRARHVRQVRMARGCSEGEAMSELALRPPRDLFLSTADVQNVKAELEKATWRRDPDEAVSVRLMHAERPGDFLVYQEQTLAATDGPSAATAGTGELEQLQPFLAGVTTGALMHQAAAWGHDRPVLLDSTFSTNKHMVSLYSSKWRGMHVLWPRRAVEPWRIRTGVCGMADTPHAACNALILAVWADNGHGAWAAPSGRAGRLACGQPGGPVGVCGVLGGPADTGPGGEG